MSQSLSRVTALSVLVLSILSSSTLGQQLQPRMGEPLDGLNAAELQRFELGKIQFDRTFQVEEGLGPTMNQNSCSSCHNNPIGGSGSITVERFGFTDLKTGAFDPLASLGGSLKQNLTIEAGCEEVIPPEANTTAIRSTPSCMGFGLLEAIPEADLMFNADNPPAGISGRFRLVTPLEGGPLQIGRFGHKGGVPTVLTFSGDAALNEMGITNDLVPTENAPNGNVALLEMCDDVDDPEDVAPLGERFIDRITDFQRFLAAPPQTPKSGMTGESIFASIGCTDCHTPSFTTPNDPALEPAIRNKTVKVYSDLLLHDMGQLFDGIVDGTIDDPFDPESCENCALAGEIRTLPLWGIRIKDPMLHDASVLGDSFAIRVSAAIDRHGLLGSEARPSVLEFQALSVGERNQVIAFLDSLGRAEFDHDGDNDIDANDFDDFLACFEGGQGYSPDNACAISDLDQDGDVDCDDYLGFRAAWTVDGPPPGIEACGFIEGPIATVPVIGTFGMIALVSMLGLGLGWVTRRKNR